jgi:osomolarity two-component system response regulator SKN7
MNDVLVKPFTKQDLFGILDKHLIHLEHIQLSAEVPRSLGLPLLPDQDIVNAGVTDAAQLFNADDLRNPLAAMGWSDETYQVALQVSEGSFV